MHVARLKDLESAIGRLDSAIAACREGPIVDLARIRALKAAREKSWRAMQALVLEAIEESSP